MSVQTAWNDVETWLRANAPKALAALRPPASATAIAELEDALGASLPAELREHFGVHDGQNTRLFISTFAGFRLLPCDEAAEVWTEYAELVDAGDLKKAASNKDGAIQPVWWSKRWIPFAEGGGGDLLCVDLDPASKGAVGQVLRFWHDEPWREALAPSVEALIAMYAADLRRGAYRVNSQGGLELA